MRLSLGFFFVLVVCGLMIALGSIGAAAVNTHDIHSSDGPSAVGDGVLADELDIEADDLRMSVDIDDDGGARWQILYRQELESDAEEEAFEELQNDIAANPETYIDPFEERMLLLLDNAQTTTEREMSMQNFEIETEYVPQPQIAYGEVTFTFEWTGFAAVDGDTLEAGDALDRLILGEDEQLRFDWPDTHRLESSQPDPSVTTETHVVWEGALEFETGEPRAVLVPADETDETAPADDTEETDEEAEPSNDDISGSMLLVGVLVLLAIVGAVFVVWKAYGNREPTEPTTEQTESSPPSDLLSNEERVLQLLEEHGGRIKQKEITEQQGWSDARTSQVVSDLREQGRIESFRLGRENVLTLPDVDLEETDETGE